jgi:UDP:flavonoid glycosyltransferase YjiC (YdhE family)
LSELVDPSGHDAIGRRILTLGASFFRQQGQLAFDALTGELGLPELDYGEFLRDETLFVPDPLVPIDDAPNIWRLPFISAGYGSPPPLSVPQLGSTCLVTFGSGNPCDVREVVLAARRHFPSVLFCSPRARVEHKGVINMSHLDARQIAPHIRAVVSHSGLGTIGTFAGHGVAQLVMPTEIDQATTAIHARRHGLADVIGLEAWSARAALGRRLVIAETALDEGMARLARRSGRLAAQYSATGAGEAATALTRIFTAGSQAPMASTSAHG